MSKLDFSEWHPLDHRIGNARCREFYGGWRNHLFLQWEYITRSKIKQHTICHLGFHSKGTEFKKLYGISLERSCCIDCMKTFGPWKESYGIQRLL